MDDNEIRALVKRLSRPHPSGGEVIESAAILSAGGDYEAIMAWIVAHGGEAEAVAPTAAKGGLHGARLRHGMNPGAPAPARFVLPARAFV